MKIPVLVYRYCATGTVSINEFPTKGLKLYFKTRVMECDYKLGFRIRFLDHLPVVTTNTYNIIADFHTLIITRAQSLLFLFCYYTFTCNCF
jgi:hypothetical protein